MSSFGFINGYNTFEIDDAYLPSEAQFEYIRYFKLDLPVPITGIQVANGQFSCNFHFLPGLTYTFKTTPNLHAEWTALYTTNVTQTPFLFVDGGTTGTQRFYRAALNY